MRQKFVPAGRSMCTMKPSAVVTTLDAKVADKVWGALTACAMAHSVISAYTAPLELKVLAPLIMWPFVDLLSGTLHIAFDNPFFAAGGWAGILKEPATGFQEHHHDTTLIARMSLLAHLGPMGVPLVASYIVGLVVHNHLLHGLYHTWMSLLILLMQMCHRWSHVGVSSRPALTSRLQRIPGLLLSPAEHAKHHTGKHDHNFCIASGLCNPALNAATRILSPDHPAWALVFLALVLLPHAVMLCASH